MAEILISLTIIGVIAAITLPALQANINESTWRAQRKALYSRMSQALSMLPSLNGYGDFTGEWADDVVTPTLDTAAEKFVTDGLNTVLQINNICSIPLGTTNPTDRHKELAKCGIPEKITNMANSKMPFPTKLSELNSAFTSAGNSQYNIDTSAAAFETKNGESIAVFYNPYCQFEKLKISNSGDVIYSDVFPNMCADFLYDLNGKKGPNKVGKDISFITAIYPVEPEVVAPMPLNKDAVSGNAYYENAFPKCTAQDANSRLPNIEELMALMYNKNLMGDFTTGYWSSTIYPADTNSVWVQYSTTRNLTSKSSAKRVRCVKR